MLWLLAAQKWPPWVVAAKGVRIGQSVGSRLAIFTWRSKNEKVGYGYGNEWVARFHAFNIIREYEEIVTKSKSCAKNCHSLIIAYSRSDA
ncbi:hypothetical protein [Lacticaseibacillus baoqingensis]|uniref:hypothetical protein n=1 Tax=Lacticaseibacillus baoqingensis TaxID=2486013 RepID=UPI0013DE69ED|nr:hypothetical protein [Lacticaseibacillus baoqingensis]